MEFITFTGESSYTLSEARKLKERINDVGPARVTNVLGSWIYYAHLKGDRAGVQSKLEQLLPLPDQIVSPPLTHIGYTRTFYITPRNISPWSSKATSIAHVAGLQGQVYRIERARSVTVEFEEPFNGDDAPWRHLLFDRMTEIISQDEPDPSSMFVQGSPQPLGVVDIFSGGQDPLEVLKAYNLEQGLALDQSEMEYLVQEFTQLGRPPHDIELFMFAQVNSEHCRHKQFNASWTIDGITKDRSLFDMIRNTHQQTPKFTVSAYSDNAAVFDGEDANFWAPEYATGSWKLNKERVNVLGKVETHNHPTAISPFPGAATGSGGEIRDEAAVGRGSTTKAGLCGFWVSDLLIPGHQAWEKDIGRPMHYASSLDIMLEAPIGSARFNNEFGRPCLTGCFRTLLTDAGASQEADAEKTEWRGYHKPIMIAGGMGNVRPQHAHKRKSDVRDGAHVIVLGGPAMLIGLGGGAASSNASGEGTAELDFNSVQRGNPEMQRRAQMVINACVALGDSNPIAMIHDVGAGGLSNALPELVSDAGFGGNFELRQIESADSSMSPLQIWCNEAQERYVLLINSEGMNRFVSICRRERCGFSDVGTVSPGGEGDAMKLVLTDRNSKDQPRPIDLPMPTLFPPNRRLQRIVQSHKPALARFDPVSCLKAVSGDNATDADLLRTALQRVFWMPSVGSKSFLITIADRSVGGLTTRDQMVGPWQTPVADVAVTAMSFSIGAKARHGEAMAMGEKPTLALVSPAASARMAVAESLMNLGAADIMGSGNSLQRVKLSANWMAAVNHPGEGAALYEAVQAIGMELCPQLDLSIPVGKDSTSMKATWKDSETEKQMSVTAPVSVVISAFTVVNDVRKTWTPQLRRVEDVGEETILLYVDLANGHKALGGSALAQSLGYVGDEVPDVRNVTQIKDYFDALYQLHESGVVLAYHDVSDGGLITAVSEMMFAGRCGVDLMMDGIAKSSSLADLISALFSEELGAVFQVRKSDETNFQRCFATCGPPRGLIRKFGIVQPKSKQTLTIRHGTRPVFSLNRGEMQQWWSKTSYEMQKLRDNPECAELEYATITDNNDPGISYRLTFDPADSILPLTASVSSLFGKLPRVAILREQGVNGAAEMAFAFRAAGFDPVDVHMTQILDGLSLSSFVGLAACGGFSYGDVLGAGQGWAKSILMHDNAREEFKHFFERKDTFSLGVCNGCQMLTRLKELIPGAAAWPNFVDNLSEQFEARFSMVKIDDSRENPSVFLHGMSGSYLPIVVSHGEGRAAFSSPNYLHTLSTGGQIPIRYVNNRLQVTETYPSNPNGSPEGIAAVSSKDGRVLAMMPHPERTVMSHGSYVPPGMVDEMGEFGPWVRMFRSARRWVG